jgi:hypothetical protein
MHYALLLSTVRHEQGALPDNYDPMLAPSVEHHRFATRLVHFAHWLKWPF